MQHRLSHQKSPLAQVVTAVLALVAFAVAVAVGLTLFLALLGVAAVALLAFYLRARWRGRGKTAPQRAGSPQGEIIEGEYRVEPAAEGREQVRRP